MRKALLISGILLFNLSFFSCSPESNVEDIEEKTEIQEIGGQQQIPDDDDDE